MPETNQKYDQTTTQFAKLNGVTAPAVANRLCLHGNYFGIKPIKLANGRLLWPSVQVKA